MAIENPTDPTPVESAKAALQKALQALEKPNNPAALFEAYTETRMAMAYLNLANNAAPPPRLKEN